MRPDDLVAAAIEVAERSFRAWALSLRARWASMSLDLDNLRRGANAKSPTLSRSINSRQK
jgi:hypothetical protein